MELEQAGLVRKSENTNKYYDFFRNRLIFPFRDYHGSLIGFAGRAINDAKPKYINSPAIELFHKSSFFYGLFQARKAIEKKKRIIIVEGYTDVMRMAEQGFAETVCLAGTAITEQHINQLRQKNFNAIFLLDSDNAGRASAEKAARLSLINGISAKIAFLPAGKDPDDFFLDNDATTMEQLLEQASPILTYILKQGKERFVASDDLNHKNEIYTDLINLAKSIIGATKQNFFLEELANYFELNSAAIKTDYKLIDTKPQFSHLPENEFQIQNTLEVKIIALVLQNPKLFPLLKQYLEPNDFLEPDLAVLVKRLFSIEEEDIVKSSFADFLQFFRDDDKIIKIVLFCAKHSSLPKEESLLKAFIYKLKKKIFHHKFSKASFYLSNQQQKELLENYKVKLTEMQHLYKDSSNKRVFFKINNN